MKKSQLLSVIAMITTIAAFGQSHHIPCGNPIVDYRIGHTAAKTTTGSVVRCIAAAYQRHATDTSYVPGDSVTYTYSGSRGGATAFGGGAFQMKYDIGLGSHNTGSAFIPSSKTVQTFDSHDNILVRTGQHYDAPTSSFINDYQETFTYDTANNALTITEQNWDVPTSAWVNLVKMINTYTSSNNLDTRLMQDWTGTAWNSWYLDTFTYNSSNKLTLDLKSTWTGSSWDTSSRMTITYDASDNPASAVNQSWSSGTWQTQDSTTYSNYAAPGLFQTVIHRGYDYTTSAIVNRYKDTITYNGYNQPVYYFEQSWDTSTSSWATDTFWAAHYYYELYSAGIANINSNATTLDVYPNPASGIVNISAVIAESRNTTITLLDVTGRTVRTIDGSEIKEGSNNIQCSVEQLPAGAYFIHLTNNNANITRKVIISK